MKAFLTSPLAPQPYLTVGLRTAKAAALALPAMIVGGVAQAQPDYAPAHWVPMSGCSKWYTSGNGHHFCVIHDMEGYYWSTISYLDSCSVTDSVYYLVNGLQNGSDNLGHVENHPSDPAAGDITQEVRESNYAWHAGCWNTWMFGTEHEGFASTPAWYSEGMYQASALLQRHLCDTYGIPKDRNHIIAHGQKLVAGWCTWLAANYPSINCTCNSHTDPGPYWDWTHFMNLVIGGTDNASFVSKTLADNTIVAPGQAFACSWTMNNNGTTTWTANSYSFYNNGGTAMGAPASTPVASDVAAGGNAAFAVNFTAPTTPGSYTVDFQMRNSSSAYFGPQVALTIVVATPPTITTQPASQTKNPGATATFTTAASGTAPLGYQWKKNGTSLASRGNVSGATSATLTLSSVQLSDAASYTVVVTNLGGTATSQQAALTVTSTPYPTGTGIGLEGQYFNNLILVSPSITRTDAFVNFNWGTGSPDPLINTDRFSVRWTGQVQPLYSQTYTFYTTTDDGVRLWVNGVLLIDKWVNQSATEWSGTIVLIAGQKYNLQMDYYENTGSAVAQLSWSSASEAKAIIPTTQLYPAQPSGQTGPIPGVYNTGVDNNNSLLAAGATDPHYKLLASADSSYPGPGSLVVNEGSPIPPWLTNGPNSKWIAPRAAQNVGNLPGNYTYRLTFDLTGLDPNAAVVTGNWAVDNSGVDILLNGASTGQSNPNGFGIFSAFVITNGFLGGTNTLDFVVNNAGTTTNPTGLRVELSGVTAQAFPAAVVAPPQNQTVNQGANATFSVVASGTAPLGYQWRFNSVGISGATGTSYTRGSVQPADAGSYSVVVSNAFGTATSSDVLLAVNVPPSITAQPQNQNANQGANATFSVVASGTGPLSYQWQRNSTGIPGATTVIYTRNNATR